MSGVVGESQRSGLKVAASGPKWSISSDMSGYFDNLAASVEIEIEAVLHA